MDVVLLSRLQFALTIMFHYIFPPLAIGMGVVLVYLEAMYLRTKDPMFETAARFWTKIFALNFAVGVATGIVMEFEFGTNWAVYSRFVGDVFGSALAAEGIFAFFLESGFLAILVFGWDKVSAGWHFFSTLMVSLGSIFSSIWIVVANSWQQTPAGHHIVQMTRDGKPWFVNGEPMMRAEIVDFWQLVFNPSTLHRLLHVWIGAFIMGSFFIMSISAWYLLKRRHEAFARHSFRGALTLATLASLAALVSGHFQARNVYHQQPAKLAAFEGHYQSGPGDLNLLGIPNDAAGKVDMAVAIPGGLSFLVHDDFQKPLVGLQQFRPEDRPPTAIPFASYHLMIVLGMFFIAVTLLASILAWRGRLYQTRWLLWVFVFAVLGAVAANQTGWIAAEVGRQPWIVQPPIVRDAGGEPALDADGYVRHGTIDVPMPDGSIRTLTAGLRTRAAVSEVVTANHVLASMVMFGIIYSLLFVLWIFILNGKIQKGPEPAGAHTTERHGLRDAASALAGHQASLTRPEEV